MKTIANKNNITELSINDNKIILIDTDKVYNKKVGTMLKTYDNKYISRKVINNKKNKLYWRHIFSLLPEEIINDIQQRIYRYIFQRKVLKIDKLAYCVKNNKFDINNFNQEIFELHNIDTTGRNTFTNGGFNMDNPIEAQEYERRRLKQLKEEWIMVDTFKTDLLNKYSDEMTFYEDNEEKFYDNLYKRNYKSKKLINAMDKYQKERYFVMDYRCLGLLKNGSLCGCCTDETVRIKKRDYYNKHIIPAGFSESATYSNRWPQNINHIFYKQKRKQKYLYFGACKNHIDQMIDLREYFKIEQNSYMYENTDEGEGFSQRYLDKIYEQLGYKVRNGYMCKICPK
tara:strand:- start:288 stop:1313 length:1026 start_codon:yes stop_codon:yes gene_type:complete